MGNLAIIIVVIIAIIIGLITLTLAIAASKPDTFSIERVAGIKASPEKIFALINDFHKWSTWSPWEKIDPNMKRTFSGAKSGKGAVYAWEGNKKAGSGRMEITDVKNPSSIIIKLDFIKPFEANNFLEYKLEKSGDSTAVTWKMYGPNTFFGKIMSIFFNMDKLIGKDFETGFANLKAAVE